MFDRWLADGDDDATDRAARSGVATAMAAVSTCAACLALGLGAAMPAPSAPAEDTARLTLAPGPTVDLVPFAPCPCDLAQAPPPPEVRVAPGDAVTVPAGACGDTCDDDAVGGAPAGEEPPDERADPIATESAGEVAAIAWEIACRFPVDPVAIGAGAELPPLPAPRPLTLRSRTRAAYPDAARALDLPDQRCAVTVAVDREGRPGQLGVDGCAPVFREAARALVAGWRWDPPTIDEPYATAALTTVGVTFRRADR